MGLPTELDQRWGGVNKKATILKTAIRLFASQGYEATTTLQIAREVGVTEPAVFYHFKSKGALFSTILEKALDNYIGRLDALQVKHRPASESLVDLIRMHFAIVAEEMDFMRILLRACPARLNDPEDTCSKVYRHAGRLLKETLDLILTKGADDGIFIVTDMDATVHMLLALLNGLMRQQIAVPVESDGVEAVTIAFCKRALVP